MLKLPVRLATAIVLLLPVSWAHAADPVAERMARVENGLLPRFALTGRALPTSTLAARMAALNVPGVSVAVINNGKLEWARGYGVIEAGGTRAVDADTLFQAASISKPVAALAALHLAEKGKLSLDEDVNVKLGAWKVPAGAQTAQAPVTMRNLLNHSAGTTVSGFRGYAAGQAVPTLAQVLDGATPANSDPVRVDIRPGEKFRYSGGGLSIAQLVMTTAAGKPFAPLMKDIVLDPLRMTRSTFEQPLPAALHANAATAHDGRGVPVPGKWHTYPEQAAAGLWTTPSDLARFAIELQQAHSGRSSKVVSQAMATQMLTQLKGKYGLGIGVDSEEGLATFSHSGSNQGFRTMLFGFAGTGQGAVVMTNGDRGDQITAEVMRSIAAAYGWKNWRVTEKTAATVDPKVYAHYVGTFELGNVTLAVTQEGGRLFIAAPMLDKEPREIFPAGEHRFFNLTDAVEFSFEQGEAGKYDLVVIAGQPRKATRKL